MRVRAEWWGSAVIIDLDGRLTVEADTRRLHELVRAMEHSGASHVVLNLGRVQQLDCSGIGQLVQLHHRARRSGVTFALVDVEPRQKQMLQLAGLVDVFQVFATWSEAVLWARSPAGRVRHVSAVGLQPAALG